MRKMRNRDAAQRARDKAKKKFEELCDEVEMLKMENEFLRKKMVVVCLNCQQEVVVKEEEQESPVTTNIVVENQHNAGEKQNYDCRFERMPALPSFQYPFFFGLLTIIACFILILSGPCDDEYAVELRVLENIIEKNWRETSLTREVNEGRVVEDGRRGGLLAGRGRAEYEYFRKHVAFVNPMESQRRSSLVI